MRHVAISTLCLALLLAWAQTGHAKFAGRIVSRLGHDLAHTVPDILGSHGREKAAQAAMSAMDKDEKFRVWKFK
ncbi:hypothetical protein EsH8_IX_000560 [Colletotrichum jinshuiense]